MYFLNKSASYIFQKHTLAKLKKCCIVLPSRRAVFYFKKELSSFSDIPFIAPEVLAVDDFVMKFSGVRPIDSIQLIFELYESFKKYDENVDFDRFVVWGTTLLKDFEVIDQYLIEKPKEVFDYMSDAKAIARWGEELKHLGKEVTPTDNIQKYFKLFENIYNAYNDLTSRLKEKGYAYRGMAYRMLANEISEKLIENKEFSHYYFVGLNALSRSEEKIVEALVKAKKAETLWDTDSFYMNSDNKAGKVLQNYKRWGKFGEWNWQTNDLLTSEKNIRFIGIQNNTLQTKVAGEIYADALAKRPHEQAVMILSDEALLSPLLFSLDESVQDFNITMGLSLKSSMLATLIDSIFELQQTIVEFKSKSGETFKIPKFSHRHIHKVLNHPFIRRYELIKYESNEAEGKVNPIRSTLRHIVANNLVYQSEKELLELGNNEKLFQLLFSRWNNDIEKVIKTFYDLIDLLREVYRTAPDAIEIEYLYLFLTILNRLENVIPMCTTLNVANFRYFLNELIRQEKIPFSGEPVADLQIMSMLESRCLDFDHVIILSLNEGVLPSSSRNQSLIPFDACIEFGLPVFQDQDAVMAYHFFRLLQRAKHIDLLYLAEGSKNGGNDPSRFILQVEHELAKINKKIKIEKPVIQFVGNHSEDVVHSISVTKTPEIIQSLKHIISEKGLYPSHISTYLRCSLNYYFSKVADLAKREEVDENVGADIFGNWIHKVLEDIDKDYTKTDNLFRLEYIDKIIAEIPTRLQKAHEELFAGILVEQGINSILKDIAEQVLIQFFEEQRISQTFPYEVLDVEKTLATTLAIKVGEEVQKVRIAGRVDRIERHGKTIKVVDYKTGMVYPTDIKKKDKSTLEESLLDKNNDKLRQLWMYQYLMLKKISEAKDFYLGNELIENHEVLAKIYSFRNISANLETNLHFENQQTTTDYIFETEQLFQTIITELLNPEVPFLQTTDTNDCTFCNFKGICGR